MKNHQPILTYLLIFLALSIILKFFGIINYDGIEILGYAFIFYGISTVYISFGRDQKGFLFIGSFMFLIGLVFFILSNFSIVNPREIVVPALMLITGISLFMLFTEGNSNLVVLGLSILLTILGIVLTGIKGDLNLTRFFESIVEISLKYWPVLIIVAGIILLIRRHERKA